MIRLLLYTDSKLQHAVAAMLGPDYCVVVQSNKDEVKRLINTEQTDILILDLDSTNVALTEQLNFLEEIKGSRIPILVMTDDDKRSTAMELVGRGVYDYFRKPPSIKDLKFVVGRAYEHAKLKRELEQAKDKLRETNGCDQLIGFSRRSQAVYDLIRRTADLDAFVLITGESGTGKELVAKAIHRLGHRRNFPFVAISCGAIPEQLIEGELFGHEKGAYTGATGSRIGYLEQAGAGTVFLDEIGEISLNTQVKLLRVLQEREFCRLGSNRPIPLRARILFATHRSLQQMVETGSFRQDLYFRVNVLRIEVPALRDKLEDIPLLAKHFISIYADAYGKAVRDIDGEAMKLLLRYSWPGNIRELENLIQRVVVLCEGDVIRAEDIPENMQELTPALTAESELESGAQSFEQRLREFKLRLATQAIIDCSGNKTLAAQKLRISRAYLHRLLKFETSDLEVAS